MSNIDVIINLSYHVSKVHPQMSMFQRAAQFAPFTALTSYKEAVDRTTAENEAKYEPSNEEDFNFKAHN